jgi:hypothetical protein
LIKILSSDSLQIESEDYLFELVSKMVRKEKNRMILLKFVKLDYVSGHLLKEFFESVPNDEIDSELLEELKKALVSDHSDIQKLSKRWKISPKVYPQKK